MPITWRVNGYRIDIVFTDPYSGPEAEAVMKQIYAHPDVTRPLRFLVDVGQSSAPDTEFVSNAITFWQLHIRQMRGAQIAVVVATEGQVRMARISELSAESRELPFTMRVFHEAEREEAERWLEPGA